MPIRDAKVANRVLGKAVKAFAEGFVINFLPEREQPLRRLRFRHGSGCHFLLFVCLLFVDQGRHFCFSSYEASGALHYPIWARLDMAAITSEVIKSVGRRRWGAVRNGRRVLPINRENTVVTNLAAPVTKTNT